MGRERKLGGWGVRARRSGWYSGGGEERVEFWGRKVEGEVEVRTLIGKERRWRSITCLFKAHSSANISLKRKDVRATSH